MAYHCLMSRFAPLLRALLCLVVLFNGTTYAHAATRMALGDMASAASSAVHDEPPCHETMDMAPGAVPDAALHAGGHDDSTGLPDCCKAGTCDGFCAQHAPVLAWPVALGALQPLTSEAPTYHPDTHASARLSHRHRPPIQPA